ncbi:MAG: MarR family transcriptional regulator [Deltaproteobacteria bacterium]|nr:MarR family transcriptional regulator [Deltaproteobacteria bacterium]
MRMNSDITHYDDCIVFLMAKAYQKAYGNLKKRLAAYGITPVQSLILAVLWEADGLLTAGEIGKKLTLDGATLSGALNRMADNGWIVKQTDRDDRRRLLIDLSDRARSLSDALCLARDQANDDILKHLRLEEKLLLKRLLRDVHG